MNLPLISQVVAAVTIPVIALGGAGSVGDLGEAVRVGHADAAAAGSLFVFHGPHQAVLIQYPSQAVLEDKVFLHGL
jgi:cyclase